MKLGYTTVRLRLCLFSGQIHTVLLCCCHIQLHRAEVCFYDFLFG